ncbi:CRTAC1 family protein [Amylibacter sp.]|nr:CRTAC1 family protein [Amylibacter sp.]MDB2600766.1 CRTAC1 family protein [Amylibacter sp.]
MKTTFILTFLISSQVYAAPLFEDLSNNLPQHSYSGEWNHFVGGGVAVMDCNNDALPDIFAAGGTSPSKLFVNEANFRFSQKHIPEITGSTGAYPIDINADGYMDLFVLQLGPNILLKGGPDCSFSDATKEFNIPDTSQWSTAFTAWWQNDGLPFMAVGNYVDLNDPKGPFFACDTHQILEPNGNIYKSNKLEPGFCSLSMLTAKDASGEMRLRISNDRQYYVRNGYEQMWDLYDQRFLTEADGWDKFSIWGMGIASRDITGDGRDEVVLTSMGDQLLRLANSDGTYKNAPFEIGTYAHKPYFGDDGRPSTGWHAQFSDINNDGLADLFIAKGNVDQMPSNAIKDPNNLLIQQTNGLFQEVGLDAGIASLERGRGAALADFDLDGRIDILVMNRRAPMEIYRNVTKNTGNWLAIQLVQKGGNINAIGSRITIGKDSQQVTIGGGHAGGQALPIHFGLGDAKTAIINIEWPDGSLTEHRTNTNQILKIRH